MDQSEGAQAHRGLDGSSPGEQSHAFDSKIDQINQRDYENIILQDFDVNMTKQDTSLFLREEFSKITREHPGGLTLDWPGQLYSSGLIFAPQKALIRGNFVRELSDWLSKDLKVEENWSPELQTLEGHSHYLVAYISITSW
jgi:hypothetical protein